MKLCAKCRLLKEESDYNKNVRNSDGMQSYCRSCASLCAKESLVRGFKNDYRKYLLFSSRCNASVHNAEHTINLNDIILVKYCPYLELELDYTKVMSGRNRSNNCPSLDRIDPLKGYVPGNVQVISLLANRMKQNADIHTLILFAKNALRIHSVSLCDLIG